MTTSIRLIAGLAGVALAATVGAKLPAPQLSEEQKTKAQEAAAKSAHAAKVDAYQLCRSMDRVAERYGRDLQAKGKALPVTETKPCADPGPFQAATK